MKRLVLTFLSTAAVCAVVSAIPAAAQDTVPGAPRGTAPVTVEGYGNSSGDAASAIGSALGGVASAIGAAFSDPASADPTKVTVLLTPSEATVLMTPTEGTGAFPDLPARYPTRAARIRRTR